MRTILPAAVLLLSGCAAADRESYSLIIRSKSHEYRDPSLPPPAPLPPEPGALREVAGLARRLDRVPFRPFAYCTLHQTDHAAESVIALGAAPVEYPLSMAAHLGSGFVLGTVQTVGAFLGFGPPPVPAAEDSFQEIVALALVRAVATVAVLLAEGATHR